MNHYNQDLQGTSVNGAGWTNMCYEQEKNTENTSHYLVDEPYVIPPGEQSSGPAERMPPSPPNGGIFGGPQSTRPWANIPVTPTATNLIHNNLLSANPPPGANVHYPGSIRFGNNYQAMPGIYRFNPNMPEYLGLHTMVGTIKSDK